MGVNQVINLVLYVEDEESDRIFMERAFGKAGLGQALRMAVNGQEAIDYLSGNGPYANRDQHPLPGIVLLDLNMPVVTGFEVLQWMKEDPQLTALPVVIFSSSTKGEDKAKARELGANEYLEKPHSVSKWGEVVERLRSVWGLSGGRDHPAERFK
jgi:CheY-like chemotaxis protein